VTRNQSLGFRLEFNYLEISARLGGQPVGGATNLAASISMATERRRRRRQDNARRARSRQVVELGGRLINLGPVLAGARSFLLAAGS